MIRAVHRVLPAMALAGVACGGGGLAPLPIPLGLAKASPAEAAAWADSTRPADSREIRFRFQFQDEQGAGGGRGRVRLALPDSLRFDIVGALGSGRAAAFVLGDSAIWADPQEEVQKLVPNYPLFWAMLGVARAPAQGTSVRKLAGGTITAWQFVSGGDTLEYLRETGTNNRLFAEVREGRKRLGRVETKFGPDGFLASSRLIVPSRSARLGLTFIQNEKARPFAPDTWTRPAPPLR